jgi:hypothetical protein
MLALSIIGSTRLLLNIRHAYYTNVQRMEQQQKFTHGHVPQSPSSGTVLSISKSTTMYYAESDEPSYEMEPVSNTRAPIYADATPRDVWASPLRELRWAGF